MDNHRQRAPTQTYTFNVLSFLSKEVFYTHIQIKSKEGPLLPLKREGKNTALERSVSPNATVPGALAVADP